MRRVAGLAAPRSGTPPVGAPQWGPTRRIPRSLRRATPAIRAAAGADPSHASPQSDPPPMLEAFARPPLSLRQLSADLGPAYLVNGLIGPVRHVDTVPVKAVIVDQMPQPSVAAFTGAS